MQLRRRIHLILLGSVLADIWKPHEPTDELMEGRFHYPAIICDAGSTGSRIFAFYVQHENEPDDGRVSVELMGRTNIGLSEFASTGSFEEAADSLLPYISKGVVRLGPTVPILIFATGGVRQLPGRIRDLLWDQMRNTFDSKLDGHLGRVELSVLDGKDEALFGLLSANYLLNDIRLDDIKSPLPEPVGVLDLGGSSLEVAVAGADNIVGSHDDILISFTGLGLRSIMERLAENDSANVCSFEIGFGEKCRKVIRSIILDDADYKSKIGAVDLNRIEKFVAISAFAYAMDFAHWLMAMKTATAIASFSSEYPSPTITSMQEVCDTICSYPLLDALFRQHRFTTSREVPERCFHVCYVSEVLSILLESRVNDTIVNFLVQVSLSIFYPYFIVGSWE